MSMETNGLIRTCWNYFITVCSGYLIKAFARNEWNENSDASIDRSDVSSLFLWLVCRTDFFSVFT